MIDPTLDYIRIDEELVVICPMILASYSGPCDEATADYIHMCGRTAVYCTDNNIVFCGFSHILGGSALWVNAKCAVKIHNRWLAYKRIYNHLFQRNVLGNRDAACETNIGRLENHVEKNSFDWEKYKNLLCVTA